MLACTDQSADSAGPNVPPEAGGGVNAAWGSEDPRFNIEIILRSPSGGTGFGLVKFRQPNDAELNVNLETWVRGLTPGTAYALQRAVDLSAPDDICASESGWLSLGKGLIPQAIVTDARGSGRAELFRNLAAFPVGTEFDIHFRVVDEATESIVVLQSDC